MQGLNGQFHIFPLNKDRNFYLGGCDNLNIDPLTVERAEHLCGHTRMAAHADAHNRDLCHSFICHQVMIVDVALILCGLHCFFCAQDLIGWAGEGHISAAIFGDVLNDHVDIYPGL